jgi:nitroimidazol reductase NimA-like FMN-containing flavoprotein (pyridoxamine 5'-phosphate oxidase superfamily)
MNSEERLEFVRSHRVGVFGVNRKNDGPAMTIVYYVMDGTDLLISTMEARGKIKAVKRDPRVSFCVLDEHWPPTYLQLYCNASIDATIDTDLEKVVDMSMAISSLMAGQKMPESVRDATRERVIAERRVQLRLRPYASFESPPRHVYTPKDVVGLTHGLGTRLPWE